MSRKDVLAVDTGADVVADRLACILGPEISHKLLELLVSSRVVLW